MPSSNDVTLKFVIEAVDKAGNKLDSIAKGFNKVEQESKETLAQTKRLGSEGSAALQKMESGVEKLTKSFDRLKTVGDKLTSLGTQLAVVGAGMAAAAAFPVAKAASFEKALSGVVAVTTGAAEKFSALSETAQEFGRTTKFTATEAAEGMKFLGQAGFEADEVISAIGPSLNLAAAGGLELADAADIASNVLQAFQLNVSDLGHVTDVLANTAASSNTNVYQLSEAMKYAAPAAAAAGVSLEEAAAAIGVLGNNGIQASLAGTSLRGLLASLAAPTKVAQDALNRLNVEIKLNEDGSIDLLGTLKRLGEANMSLADANAIFRRQGAAAALVLAKQTEEADKLTKANLASAGAAEKMAKIMQDNLLGSLTKLKSAFEGLMIAVGEPLLKPLKSMVDTLTDVVTGMAEWAKEHETLASIIAGSIGTFGALLAAVGALAIPIGLAMSAFGTLGKALTAATKLFGASTAAIGLNTAAMGTSAATTATSTVAFSKMGKVVGTAKTALVGLGRAFLPLAAAWAAFKIWELIDAFRELHKWSEKLKDIQDQHNVVLGMAQKRIEKFNSDTGNTATTMEEVNRLIKDQNLVLSDISGKWMTAADAAVEYAKATREVGKSISEVADAFNLAQGDTTEFFQNLETASKKFGGTISDDFQHAFDTVKSSQKSALLEMASDYQKAMEDRQKKSAERSEYAATEAADLVRIEQDYLLQIKELLNQGVEDERSAAEKKVEINAQQVQKIKDQQNTLLINIEHRYQREIAQADLTAEEIAEIEARKSLAIQNVNSETTQRLAELAELQKENEVAAAKEAAAARKQIAEELADELDAINQSVVDHENMMRRAGMTAAEKIIDDKKMAVQALAAAEKAMAAATTTAQKAEALKQYQHALEMFQKLELAAKQHEEKIQAEKKKTTQVSQQEKEKQVADAKAAEDKAYQVYMEALERETTSVAAENQRRRDAEEAEIAWLEARRAAAAAKAVETTKDANAKQVADTSAAYQKIGSEVSSAIDKITDAIQRMQDQVSKPVEPQVKIEQPKTDLAEVSTEAEKTGEAIETPHEVEIGVEDGKTKLKDVKQTAEDTKKAVEAPMKLDVQADTPKTDLEEVKDKAKEVDEAVGEPKTLEIATDTAKQNMHDLDEKVKEVDRRVTDQTRNYIIDDTGTKTFFSRIDGRLHRTREEIEGSKIYNLEVTLAESEVLRLQKHAIELAEKVKEDKQYTVKVDGAETDLNLLQDRLTKVTAQVTEERELGMDTTVADSDLRSVETLLNSVTDTIEQERTLKVAMKGSGSSETGLTDKINEVQGLLSDLTTQLQEPHKLLVDFADMREGLSDIKSKFDEITAILASPLKLNLDNTKALSDIERLLSAMKDVAAVLGTSYTFEVDYTQALDDSDRMRTLLTEVATTARTGATFQIQLLGLPDAERLLEVVQKAAKSWSVAVNVTVSGVGALDDLKRKLDELPELTKSKHVITVSGLDQLKKALDYHNRLDGKHTTSTHTVKVDGEGSTKKPIGEKISEINGWIDSMRQNAGRGSTFTVDFTGRASSESPLSKKIADLKKQLQTFNQEIQGLGGQVITEFLGYDLSTTQGLTRAIDDAKKKLAELRDTSYDKTATVTLQASSGGALKSIAAATDDAAGAFSNMAGRMSGTLEDAAALIIGALDKVLEKLDEMIELMDKTYQLSVDTSEAQLEINKLESKMKNLPKSYRIVGAGGELRDSFYSDGGGLPGYGGGDRVRAWLEPGEYVIKKEAVRKYGLGLFDGLNRMIDGYSSGGEVALRRIAPVPASPPSSGFSARAIGKAVGSTLMRQNFKTGGSVDQVRDLGSLRLEVGGKNFPIMVQPSVAKELEQALRRERMVSV